VSVNAIAPPPYSSVRFIFGFERPERYDAACSRRISENNHVAHLSCKIHIVVQGCVGVNQESQCGLVKCWVLQCKFWGRPRCLITLFARTTVCESKLEAVVWAGLAKEYDMSGRVVCADCADVFKLAALLKKR
jgi:hypothetical protein